MMTNLFSSFDPSTSIGSMNWLSSLLFLVMLPMPYFVKSYSAKITLNYLSNFFSKEIYIVVKDNKFFGVIITSIFLFLIANNFMGLFPYVFTSTSHMSTTMSISLSLWFGLMIWGWAMKSKEMFAHLVPMSTPGILMPFMVLIETISSVIRPMTLAIRLSANMIAGHLLLTLLGNQLASLSMLWVMLPTELMLVSLEMAVSVIQAYVFSILLTLYVSEVSEVNH